MRELALPAKTRPAGVVSFEKVNVNIYYKDIDCSLSLGHKCAIYLFLSMGSHYSDPTMTLWQIATMLFICEHDPISFHLSN
jgi:hypothetical protein